MDEPRYENCFVCGQDNPCGLKLEFEYGNGEAGAWFDSPPCYEGYRGVIHGGIIATLLDEAMAKIILCQRLAAVTADLSIRYRKPLPVGTKVRASGRITLQKSRTIRAEAVLADEAGNVYAESTAVYIVKQRLP